MEKYHYLRPLLLQIAEQTNDPHYMDVMEPEVMDKAERALAAYHAKYGTPVTFADLNRWLAEGPEDNDNGDQRLVINTFLQLTY